MVKHFQTIRRLLLTNCLSVSDHFVGLALKGLIAESRRKKLSLIFDNAQTNSFPSQTITKYYNREN